LLRVDRIGDDFVLKDQCTPEEEAGGELKVVFENGNLVKDWTLAEVRGNLAKYV
jgi:nicotinamide phosphoribosyltransferase